MSASSESLLHLPGYVPPQYVTMNGSGNKYFYYRLDQAGSALVPYQRFISGIEGESDQIGRIHVDDIPPPQTLQSLKWSIARFEGFRTTDLQIRIRPPLYETLAETARLDFSVGAPGTEARAATKIEILSGVERAPPTPAPALPVLSPTVWWTINEATGFGEPKVDPQDKTLILASAETLAMTLPPPGWLQATLLDKKFSKPINKQGEELTFRVRQWDVIYIDMKWVDTVQTTYVARKWPGHFMMSC
ncbi:hypothetical protein DL93DRAFT_2088009 [Clavulina sp. PMI_390]|nr:hypothetical protein DL93DRAFT_2088009 [Clavulina sp. PMI_390]